MTTPTNNQIERPPVVAIMGHVDHGKSSLLDYIRASNIVAGEAGGITQHIAAYEVERPNSEGVMKKITFIDTPGHAAFSHMRNRGAQIADIAILIVSAEEGVKTQTVESIKTILQNTVPYIVAITKIDRPNANVEKIKSELLEHGVYVEGYGGSIPCVPISSKTGEGIDTILETILLLAEFEDFKGDPEAFASGFVVEANMDQKRGVSATLIIKNGTLHKGQFVVVDDAFTGTRIIENFQGAPIESATFSSPIRMTGFSTLPRIGSQFSTVATKKEAEILVTEAKQVFQELEAKSIVQTHEGTKIIPIIIKSDVFGSAEAIEGEIQKLSTDEVFFKIIKKDVGSINESDAQLALSDKNTIILGFHVAIEKSVPDMNDIEQITIKTFDIIYKLTEWLEVEREARRPRKEVDTILGQAKILKVFSSTKSGCVAGGNVVYGTLSKRESFKLLRAGVEITRGTVEELQSAKSPVSSIDQGKEFGMQLSCREEILPGDIIETFKVEIK
jgi:translation initiation factor IF-2